ncbi:MAG: hypothetical protein U0838_12735 [Chloroflexota bacterium]
MLTPILVLVAIAVVAGGVVAVAAPNPRHATLGAFGALLVAALVSDPLPSAAAVVARLAGAALGGWLVWMAVRSAPAASHRSALGWPGAAAVAVAGFAIGWLAASAFGAVVAMGVGDGLVSGAPGATLAGGSLVPRAAIAAAAALAILAAAPVILPRDGHRLGLGIVLLIASASLFSSALGDAPHDGLELAISILAALTGLAVAGVVAALLRSTGDLMLSDAIGREGSVRHRAADDAHRGAAR